MNFSAQNLRSGIATSNYRPPRRLVVCVVDGHPDDYAGWTAEAVTAGVDLHFVATAAEALRLRSGSPIDLWVVNERLAGLSGCELCEMLRSSAARSPVYLVSDEYSSEAEQAAWRARATLYGCKGEHGNWLGEWLQARAQQRATASRSHQNLAA